MTFHYTVQTTKNFDQAVEAVTQEIAKIGMRVLHIHNVQETLDSKGFQIEPLKIVEVCSAKHANTLLQKDKKMALFMPCKINVYVDDGKVWISAMDTSPIAQINPNLNFSDLAEEVNQNLRAIVDKAK